VLQCVLKCVAVCVLRSFADVAECVAVFCRCDVG